MPIKNKKQRTIKAADNPAEIIAFDADVTIEAGDAESKGPRKFDVLAYTGGKLMVAGYEHPVVIDLAGMTTRKVVVANLDHNRSARVGHVTAKENDGKQLRLQGVASAATAARDEVVASAADGFTWQASVEVAPKIPPVFVKAGKSVEVNGQHHEGPLFVARKSVLNGFAFLGQGADDNTTVRIAAEDLASQKGSNMDPKFVAWIVAMDLDVEELTDKQRNALKKKYDAEIAAAAKEQNVKEDEAEITAEEFDVGIIRDLHRDLLDGIDAKLAEHEDNVTDRKTLTTIKATALNAAKALKQKAIKEKWPQTRFEIEAMRTTSAMELDLVRAERPAGPAIHSASHDLTTDVIEAAMAQTLRVPDYEKVYSEQALESAHKSFRGAIGLKQMLIMAASANGRSFSPHESVTSANLREVLRKAFPQDIDAAFSTLSLPQAFANIANRELLAGWNLGPQYQVWREIAQTRTSTDFRPTRSVRLLDNMEYETLGPNGEIATGQVSEEYYDRSIDTIAKMWSLSRKNILNDDLGAMQDIRTRLGNGFIRKFTRIFWTTFLGNTSFFTSARGNYITGATTNLLSDGVGLQAGIDAFKALKTPDGKRAGGTPSILLHPPEVNAAAVKLYTPVAAVKASEVNIYANRYRPVECDWLSDSTLSGYSTTAWYLLQDPALIPAVVVSFLNGQENPTVESAEADFNKLGIDFRGYGDCGVDLAEWLAGVKSKGAA